MIKKSSLNIVPNNFFITMNKNHHVYKKNALSLYKTLRTHFSYFISQGGKNEVIYM